jgi:O-antigen/teichoic acid export membrane protein
MATTTRKVAEGTMIFFTRKIWISLFSGISTLLVIQALGIYHYGLLTLAFAVIGMLSPFLDFDIGSILSSDIAYEIGKKQFGNVKRMIRDYAILEIMIGFVFFFVLFIFNNFLSQKFSQEISSLVRIIALLIIFRAINNIFSTVFYGFSDFRNYSLIDGIESIIRIILVFIFYFINKLNLINVALIFLVSSLIQIIIITPLFFKVTRTLKKVIMSPEPILKNIILAHGKFHIFNQPIKSALESLRFWIIKFFISTEAVAIFNVANKLFSYISLIFNSIEGALFTILSQEISHNIELARNLVKKSVKYLTYLGILAMIFSYIFIDKMLYIFFQNKYDTALPVLYWMLPILPFVGFSTIIRPLFFAFKGQKYLLSSYIWSTLVFGYPLGIFLTYKFGIVGFAIPIGSLTAIIIRYYYIRKLDRNFYFKFSDFFNFDDDDKLLLNKFFKKFKLIKK